MMQLGIGMSQVVLTKKKIDQIFDSAKNQGDYFIALHRAVYPDWDDIIQLNDYPVVSDATGEYIFQKAIEFDRVNHPGAFAGGLWMNSGFSMLNNKGIKDWVVQRADYSANTE